MIEFFDRMNFDAKQITEEVLQICQSKNIAKGANRYKVQDIDKLLLGEYFCPGYKPRTFEELLNEEFKSKPEILEKNTFLRNMCLFLKTQLLFRSKTLVETIYGNFHYKVASIIYNNLQTGNALFSDQEFSIQVLKQVQKSVDQILQKEVDKIAEAAFEEEFMEEM
jgi:hypothetical protein